MAEVRSTLDTTPSVLPGEDPVNNESDSASRIEVRVPSTFGNPKLMGGPQDSEVSAIGRNHEVEAAPSETALTNKA